MSPYVRAMRKRTAATPSHFSSSPYNISKFLTMRISDKAVIGLNIWTTSFNLDLQVWAAPLLDLLYEYRRFTRMDVINTATRSGSSKNRELHRIGETLKDIHDVKACAYSVRVMVSLDDNGVLPWVLRRSCYALQHDHDVFDVHERVEFLFQLFELVSRDYDMATKIHSQRARRDAKRILDGVDRNRLDHGTVLTLTGFTILIRLAGFESRCPSESLYGRPGNPKRPYTAGSTEHETSDGSDGILHSRRSVY